MLCDRYNQRYQSATEALEAVNSVLALLQSSNADGSYLLSYRNFILLLGIGLGATTSLIVLVLIYTFINTGTSFPNQPTQLKRFLDKFVESRLTNVNSLVVKSAANRGICKFNIHHLS
jgi:eukaryotic-like serine/threonine-protein kinase